jgi:hypothetical protein
MTKTLHAALIVGVVFAVDLLSPSAGALAQEPGTPAQKRACRPDVFRFCAAEIPSVNKIVSCLRSNMGRLSPDCRAVFAGELR